jgi:hypothetical protein
MTAIFESPLPVILIGLFAEALLAVVFLNTRKGAILAAMGGVLAFVLVGVLVEHLVVTEREQVEAALYGGAQALEHNDRDAVMSYISPEAETLRSRVHAEWPDAYVITQVKIRNLQIKTNHLTSPPTAQARFDAVIYGYFRNITSESPYPIDVNMEFRQEDGRWLVDDNVEWHRQGQ